MHPSNRTSTSNDGGIIDMIDKDNYFAQFSHFDAERAFDVERLQLYVIGGQSRFESDVDHMIDLALGAKTAHVGAAHKRECRQSLGHADGLHEPANANFLTGQPFEPLRHFVGAIERDDVHVDELHQIEIVERDSQSAVGSLDGKL